MDLEYGLSKKWVQVQELRSEPSGRVIVCDYLSLQPSCAIVYPASNNKINPPDVN